MFLSRLTALSLICSLFSALPAFAHDIGDGGVHIHGEALSKVNEPLLYGILLILGVVACGLAAYALTRRNEVKNETTARD